MWFVQPYPAVDPPLYAQFHELVEKLVAQAIDVVIMAVAATTASAAVSRARRIAK